VAVYTKAAILQAAKTTDNIVSLFMTYFTFLD